MSENEKNNQLIVTGKQELARVSKTLAITNKLLTEIENREPSDDFRVAIPDEAFQEYLKDIGVSVENGTVAYGDVKNIQKIECSNNVHKPNSWSKGVEQELKIKSLDGIQYFKNLMLLDCSYNQLTSLDISKNNALTALSCQHNQLTSLDVSKNTALTFLFCGNNQLTSLDVSKNTALTKMSCDQNELTSLDLSKNTALTQFKCNYNQLISLEIAKTLELLICDEIILTRIDTSNNPNLIINSI